MEVVTVRLIVVGTENHMEIATGVGMCRFQKSRLARIALPLRAHRNGAAVGQRKSGDIDRIGSSMFATPVFVQKATNNVAT